MAMLIYEVWLDPDENGGYLPGLCLAGPEGDGFRKHLQAGAVLTSTFPAESTFDAMSQYYRRNGWGDWTTPFPVDHEIHSREEADAQ